MSDRARGLLAAGLQTPSLGIWWQFARDLGAELAGFSQTELLPGLLAFVGKRGELARSMDGRDNLLALRNRYAHGATPPDDLCAADVDTYAKRLLELVGHAEHLHGLKLLTDGARGTKGETFPSDQQPPTWLSGARDGETFVQDPAGRPVSLHPLLVFRESDGRFYFYNDLRKRVANLLNYEDCIHWRDGDLAEALLARFPLHEWRRSVPEVEEFRERIEALTDTFKGRSDLVRDLLRFAGEGSGYLMLWGGPGVGKSALMARVIQVLEWPEDLRLLAYPDADTSGVFMKVFPYFIRRGLGSDSALMLVRNLSQRLERSFATGVPIGDTLEESALLLRRRLREGAETLPEGGRIVLMIDGLDEATHAEGFMEALPRGDAIPGVVVIYASREHPLVRDRVWEALDRECRTATSVGPLAIEDVRAILHDHVDKYSLRSEYVSAVASKSGGNPLYLNLLCEGIRSGDFALNDAVALPPRLEDLYDDLLRRLGRTEGTLDLLCLLAAARDHLSSGAISALMDHDLGVLLSGPLHSAREVLQERPDALGRDQHQLFHESLREHLAQRYPERVDRWNQQLLASARDWEGCPDEVRGYALRHGPAHFRMALDVAAADGQREAEEEWLEALCDLLDSQAWRDDVFRACGNAGPLREGLLTAQWALLRQQGPEKPLERIIRYTLLFHDEPRRIYERHMEELDRRGRRGNLEGVEDLAAMGETPADCVLLALRACWSRGRPQTLPVALQDSVKLWLEEAGEPALEELWKESTRPRAEALLTEG